ncbi:hypothetical protein FOA52_002290 [Chlamydomonas sp. UWO 241]|nr:hypothetical protein FOA52_002290 [Chlamydomonas sp. UWO 241]
MAPAKVDKGLAGPSGLDDLMPNDEDLLYEEELLRNPYDLKMWWRYISARSDAPAKRRYLLYERALRALPGSFKLWNAYLRERRVAVRGARPDSQAMVSLNNTYERALVSMHKMPRVWIEYLEFIVDQKLVTVTRRTFDRALKSLPITQHDRIWELYLKFIRQQGMPTDTAVRVYRRYLKLEPAHAEEYIAYLKVKERWGDSARKLSDLLDDDTFRSLEGKSKHTLWLELCDVITKHPREVEGMKVDAIIRGGIRKFTDEVGRLWTSLADYYIRRSMFEKARDIYEEGITSVLTVHDFSLIFDAYTQCFNARGYTIGIIIISTIIIYEEGITSVPTVHDFSLIFDAYTQVFFVVFPTGYFQCFNARGYTIGIIIISTIIIYKEGITSVLTVHDFSLIFDAYTQFEESLIAAKMEQMADDEDEPEDEGGDGEGFLLRDDGRDLDLRLARLEFTIARRPELLNSVMLRQNPHNVSEWHKRVKLFEGNPTRQILTFTEAVKTVDCEKALGKPHSLWCAFAKFYERHGDVPNARIVFEKATQATFKYVDDLAQVWAEWAEMELRSQNFRRALDLMRRATAVPLRPRRLTPEEERALPVPERLYRSLKLWGLYVDLEESLGTVESTRGVYDKILELRIATPQIVLNYAAYLQEHKFWEDSFRVYERGVALFKYPHARDIWQSYLSHFVERYGGAKLERARDLFEQALQSAPPENSKPIYLQFALLEEQFGLAKHAMAVYARAVRLVPKGERMQLYELYLAKASEFFGIGKMREIYEQAIEEQAPHELSDADARTMGLRYAQLERKLGEIDRARAIFIHVSSLCDPRTDKAFWGEWKTFEVASGNEDTFREMLRIQRSVAASYANSGLASTIAAARAAAQAHAQGEDDAGLAGAKRGRSELDAMAEAEASALAEADATAKPATLKGFVSAGVTGGTSAEDANKLAAEKFAAAMANPEEIYVDAEDDEEDNGGAVAEEGADVATKSVPAAVFGSLGAAAAGGGGGEEGAEGGEEEPMGAMERLKKRRVK